MKWSEWSKTHDVNCGNVDFRQDSLLFQWCKRHIVMYSNQLEHKCSGSACGLAVVDLAIRYVTCDVNYWDCGWVVVGTSVLSGANPLAC